jgi:hypothetical protein
MGLLNMGKGEGPQVIQLFGRGVRLKGKKWTLKRSSFLPEEGPHPDGLPSLERLLIFGWNADYIQAFRKMLEQEDLGKELQVNVRMQHKLWKNLPIPKPKKGYKVDSETWTLQKEKLPVRLDLTPRLALVEGTSLGGGLLGKPALVDFGDESIEAVLDLDALYTDLVEYKTRRGYQNTFIPRSELLPILQGCDLYVPSSDLKNPAFLQEGASRVIRMYLDRFVAAKERSAEGGHLEPGYLSSVSESLIPYYSIRVSAGELLNQLENLLKKPSELYKNGERPLPRLHVERHLFSPLLLKPEDHKLEGISVRPPGLRKEEADFLADLQEFWRQHHDDGSYRHKEIYVLRNLPRVGVGFFRRSGFYPDFILWIVDKKDKTTQVQFLDPHGLHHGGLSGNRDKIEAQRTEAGKPGGPF